MKYLRLYADTDGESRLAELDVAFTSVDYAPPPQPFGVSEAVDAKSYATVRFPAGWDSARHPTPRRQVFALLSGEFVDGLSNGSEFSLSQGDKVLMEDTTGKGHSARVQGNEDSYAIMVHLQ